MSSRLSSTQEQTQSDPRFTLTLLHDLREVLAKHGYVPSQDPRWHSEFLIDALQLVDSYEGKS